MSRFMPLSPFSEMIFMVYKEPINLDQFTKCDQKTNNFVELKHGFLWVQIIEGMCETLASLRYLNKWLEKT